MQVRRTFSASRAWRPTVGAGLTRTLGITPMTKDLLHRATFESHDETYTRVLAQQGGEVGAEAVAWLAERQAKRDEDVASKRDAREEETLSISKRSAATADEALSTAKSANRIASEQLAAARRNARWAMYAAIIAATAAAISAKDQILALIFGSP